MIYYVIASLAICVAWAGCWSLATYDLRHPVVCLREELITSVGGCDKYAWCAVRVESGEKIKAQWPVVGEAVCMAKERR